MRLKQHLNKCRKLIQLLCASSNFRNNIEFEVGTNRLKRLLLNINFKCPILAQEATYLLEDPGKLRGLKALFRAKLLLFFAIAFFGEVRLYGENRQNSQGNRHVT